MRIISYISSIIITFFAMAIMSGCKDSEVVDDGFRTTMAKASDVKLNKVAYGGLAQLGEHLPCKQGVESSNLFISTEIERFQDGLIAQLVRAHA